MRSAKAILSMCTVLLGSTGGCNLISGDQESDNFHFDFSNGEQDWVGDFSDYPFGSEEFYELVTDYRNLPAPLNTNQKALYISGNNHSDDLFMFFKRQLSGLVPGKKYQAEFKIEFATNVPMGCFGIGGSPGESVYMKAGAATIEPIPVLNMDPIEKMYYMNIDVGNQSNSGANALVLGNISNNQKCGENEMYQLKRLDSKEYIDVQSDDNGQLWVLFGTDSGFEATSSIYYTNFWVELK